MDIGHRFIGDRFAILKRVEGGAIVGDNCSHIVYAPQDFIDNNPDAFGMNAPIIIPLHPTSNRVMYREPDSTDENPTFVEIGVNIYPVKNYKVRAAYSSQMNTWYLGDIDNGASIP